MAAAYEGIKWFRVYYQMYCSAYTNTHNQATVTLHEVSTTQSVEEALIHQATIKSNRNIETLSNDQVYAPTVIVPQNTSSKSNFRLFIIYYFYVF